MTMTRKFLSTILAVAATLAACRFTPTHVPLRGTASDIAHLAGTWDGEYSSAESGRNGAIFFEITAGVDTAHGDVLMTSPFGGQSFRAADAGSGEHERHARSVDMLTVQFVRIQGDSVRGALEPYVAPDCACTVSSIFHGKVTGDRIEGTFTTRGPRGLLQTGWWSAVRKAATKSSPQGEVATARETLRQ